MRSSFFIIFCLLFCNSCMFGVDTHKIYNTDYVVMAHSIDITKNKKKGVACATTSETNQDLVFEAARLGGLKKEIIFIEKITQNDKFCTVVYGE